MTRIQILQKILIATIFACSKKCFEHSATFNKTLYIETVDYFFPKKLRIPDIDMDHYLCRNGVLKKCCICTKICKYLGTCCMDAFYDNSITSVQEYVEVLFNMTSIKKHVKTLPVFNVGSVSVKFRVARYPMVVSCDKESPYASRCNGNNSSKDIRILADGFIYKNKYCALCHGFQIYSFLTLQLLDCKKSFDYFDTEMTAPDESCILDQMEVVNREYDISNVTFPSIPRVPSCSEEYSNLCFNSFFLNPYCALCHGPKNLTKTYCYSQLGLPGRLVHFALLINFDENGNSKSKLMSGRPICQCDQYFDISSNKCKKKLHHNCDKRISSNNNSQEKMIPRNELVPKIAEEDPKPPDVYSNLLSSTLFDCMKRMGGAAIEITRIPKKLEHLQTNQAALLRNYAYIFLSDKTFMDFFDQWRYRSMIIVPYKVLPYTELYGFSPKHHFLRNRTCADPEIIYQTKITLDCNFNGTIYNITKDATYWINITNGMIVYTAARCKRFHLEPNCKIGVLNASQVVTNNNSIAALIDDGLKSYTKEQYLPLMEGLGICLGNEKSGTKEYQWLKQYNYFANILINIVLFFSITLELLFLVCRRSQTKNIADKNLTTLSCTLLVCDITGFILSLAKEYITGMPCKLMAIWIHFFSLSLCTWISIIAYEIWSIFQSNKAVQRLNHLYLRYSVFAWGAPFLVTSVCITIDVLSKEPLITYGRQDHCWIYPLYARLVVYIVPFSVMNFGSSFIVLTSMLQRKDERKEIHKNVAKSGQINYSKLLMKLFLLFGTAELIGLIQIPNAVKRGKFEVIFDVTFEFLYNTLRSSRGIVMFLLFGWNGVRKKYRKRANMSN